jgi:hypothetical protein
MTRGRVTVLSVTRNSRKRIRDPNLIYPNHRFDLPE